MKGRYRDDIAVDERKAKALKESRTARGRNLAQASGWSGVSSETLRLIEHGKLRMIRRETAVLLGWLK